VIVTLVSTLSVAVAGDQDAISVVSGLLSATLPGHVILGSSLSSTVTVKVQALLLLAASVAVYVTSLAPIPKTALAWPATVVTVGDVVTVELPLLSVTVGAVQLAVPKP
jgi:hypothetical protein